MRDKQGIFATWLAFTFQFPLVGRPKPSAPDPASGRSLDPQTRVGVAFGAVLGVSRSLDLFSELSVLDRGDLDDPRTTLAILDGGFDQNRVVFGFNRRFGDAVIDGRCRPSSIPSARSARSDCREAVTRSLV